MKVLTTSLCYPAPDEPDLGLFIQRRALALRRLGHEVRVVSPRPWCPVVRRMRALPEASEPLPARYPRMFSVPVIGWATDGVSYARVLRRAIAGPRRADPPDYDVIDAHFVYPDGVGACLVGQHLGIPVVVTVRGKIVSLAHRPVRRAQIRAMLRRASAVVAVSEHLASCVRAVAGRPIPVDVIPNGIDPSAFHPLNRDEARRRLGWEPAARYVLAVGHLQRLKGFDRLVRIWPAVRARCSDARLVLAGSTRGEPAFARRLLADLERLNRGAGAEPHSPGAQFVGPQSPPQLNLMYNAADLLVSSSRSEGWCNAISEALATGTPVVATDVGGNREQIRRPELGFLVPDGDPAALAEAVVRALRQPWDRSRIAAAGAARTWDHVALEVQAVLERAVAGQRPDPRVSRMAENSIRLRRPATAIEVPR